MLGFYFASNALRSRLPRAGREPPRTDSTLPARRQRTCAAFLCEKLSYLKKEQAPLISEKRLFFIICLAVTYSRRGTAPN
ncbi:hypothetical protein JOC27_002254, partial [Sporolactobacillus spathodeae]|nr:hypothetical protein [Sporolactobacillus spathodeae]